MDKTKFLSIDGVIISCFDDTTQICLFTTEQKMLSAEENKK